MMAKTLWHAAGRLAVALAAIGCSLGPTAWADLPAVSSMEEAASVHDLVLGTDGMLVGQVVTPEGQPIDAAMVYLLDATGHPLATVMGDAQGRFAVRGVPTGVYQLAAGDRLSIYRCWTGGAAPPVAQTGALLTTSSDAVRAQWTSGPLNALVCKTKALTP
jgi:hypothetical protein